MADTTNSDEIGECSLVLGVYESSSPGHILPHRSLSPGTVQTPPLKRHPDALNTPPISKSLGISCENQNLPPINNSVNDDNSNLCIGVTGLNQQQQQVITIRGSGMGKPYVNPCNPNFMTMNRSGMFVLSTATGPSMPTSHHSNMMAPPITLGSNMNSQRIIDSNMIHGRQRVVPSPTKMKTRSQTRGGRSRVYRDFPEDYASEDPHDFWEEDSVVRERNAKRARNGSNSSSDNEYIAQRPKIAHKEPFMTPHFQPQQQILNKKQQAQQSSQQQDSSANPQSPNKFTTGFDDFAFSKNPAGAGIEFGAVCGECGVVCVTGAGWTAHQNGHRGEGANCNFCPQVFLTHHARDAHQQLHRDGHCRDVDDYCECGLCGGSFVAVMYLELHLLELHGRESLDDPRALHLGPSPAQDPSRPTEDDSTRQLFRCGVCHNIFTYSLNLDCHMALHTEVSYACALCDAAYPSLDPLIAHSQIHRYSVNNPMAAQSRRLAAQRNMGHVVPPNIPMWGPQNIRNAVPNPQMSGTQGAPANTMGYNPTMSGNMAMNPAMVNYCMMMSSIFGGPDKSSVSNDGTNPKVNKGEASPVPSPDASNQSMWPPYMNPSLAHVFNYFNPYLLNNVNNMNQSANSNCSDNNNNNIVNSKEPSSEAISSKTDSQVSQVDEVVM